MERSLLRWDVDDYNNTMGAFLGLVWLAIRFLKMELLMSHDKTKTLGLGILDWEEKQQGEFYLKDSMKTNCMWQILMDIFWIG
jgi:hypothetical protein